ncbi:MAG: PEP-utilizing enzyme, partial [Gammaproteobacteria bacterium]
PGTEGWQDMYPYYTRFQPEDDQRFWFYNSMHFPEPMPAFDIITAEVPYHGMGAFTSRVFAFPTALGVDHRIINGRIYITANTVTDPAEIERRLAVFQKRAGHYYENWDDIYKEWQERILSLIREIDAIEVPELPEFDDEDVVMQARGIAQNHYVREAFHRCIEGYTKMWMHHFEMLMLGYGAYVVFFQFCKQAFPEIADQTVSRMVSGIDVTMFRPDDELKRLAKLAVELGIDDLFVEEGDPQNMMDAIGKQGKEGDKWLAELDKSREPWFNISTGDGFYHHHLSWNEENHKFYCEHWYTTRFFKKIREFGQLLQRYDVVDEADDIFHLHYSEAMLALSTVMTAWAAGSPPVAADHWKPVITRRKQILEKLADWSAPPALGPIPESIEDPALQMLWGITSETLASWARDPEELDENEINGYAASPGVVEGTARVLKNVNDIGLMQEGEILVCPVTNPSWAPVFGKIKAAVSDIGGTMSHAAIVAREYGMPAVVGTGQATHRIKTGQRLRVDGDSGIVTILE